MYESGALNPSSKIASKKAYEFYDQIANRKTDYINVARNTKLSLEQCKIVKNYLFYDRHELVSGYQMFEPDIAIAQSWLRLSEKDGHNILPHDVLLLYHELREISLLINNTNMSQSLAHTLAESEYNYSLAVKNYYLSIGIVI